MCGRAQPARLCPSLRNTDAHGTEHTMHTNLFLAEELTRQRRQQFLEAAVQDRLRAQLPYTRWRSVQRIFQLLKATMNGATRWSTWHLSEGKEVKRAARRAR